MAWTIFSVIAFAGLFALMVFLRPPRPWFNVYLKKYGEESTKRLIFVFCTLVVIGALGIIALLVLGCLEQTAGCLAR